MDHERRRHTMSEYCDTNSNTDMDIESEDLHAAEDEAVLVRSGEAAVHRRTGNREWIINEPSSSNARENMNLHPSHQSTSGPHFERQPLIRHRLSLDSITITVDTTNHPMITLQIPMGARNLQGRCPFCETTHRTQAGPDGNTTYDGDRPVTPGSGSGSSSYNITPAHRMIAERRVHEHAANRERSGEGIPVTQTGRGLQRLIITESLRTTESDMTFNAGATRDTRYPTSSTSSSAANTNTTPVDQPPVTYLERRSSMDSMLAQAGGDTPRSAFPDVSPLCTCRGFMN